MLWMTKTKKLQPNLSEKRLKKALLMALRRKIKMRADNCKNDPMFIIKYFAAIPDFYKSTLMCGFLVGRVVLVGELGNDVCWGCSPRISILLTFGTCVSKLFQGSKAQNGREAPILQEFSGEIKDANRAKGSLLTANPRTLRSKNNFFLSRIALNTQLVRPDQENFTRPSTGSKGEPKGNKNNETRTSKALIMT
jgi:hypothetical protein